MGLHAHKDHVPALELVLGGRVQGVGFRPFVYRLARKLGLCGWVRNCTGRVQILVQGDAAKLDAFVQRLSAQAPPLARPRVLSAQPTETARCTEFAIRASDTDQAPSVHVPPDYFTCEDCLRELHDPRDRRHRYPFINCTQCGPRYTLIRRLPYDRPNTTMDAFPLCADCAREYADPGDRRFHAEPLACPRCGPRLSFHPGDGPAVHGSEASLAQCVHHLQQGAIVAVRGIGGYHLMCDARNTPAVERLRATKPRPHKPLAVMVPQAGGDGLAQARRYASIDARHAEGLTQPARPIVLVPIGKNSGLSSLIAPGLDEVGLMLPYSPLHHLLLEAFDGPLVATSANVRGEPVLTDPGPVEERLGHVLDACLHHDRLIQRPADDPVVRIVDGAPRPLRLGRGTAPLERALPFPIERPLLAVGGHMKNTVALAWEDRIVISPHVGDLEAPRSLQTFERTIADLQQLYAVRAEHVVCDAHPGYASHRWARGSGLEVLPVWHHHAHASGMAGEFPHERNWLVFTWDGVGLGADGTLWGGEALYGGPGHWRRVASLRPFFLPGGERAARQPWRSAAALCWATDTPWSGAPEGAGLLHAAWAKGINCPQSTAVGRLFDAAAALVGLVHEASFEGQGPMWLEAAAGDMDTAPLELPLHRESDGVWRLDWTPLLPMLLDEALGRAERAACFHASLAAALVAQAKRLRQSHGELAVGLTGGVFQNRRLAQAVLDGLRAAGFRAYLPRELPCNDAGLSFGQVIEASALD